MRVLVTGGRTFSDEEVMDAALSALMPIDALCHGKAKGADLLAGRWAWAHGIRPKEYPADWKAHGRAAGHIRNAEMFTDFIPTVVVAFKDYSLWRPKLDKGGTEGMVKISLKAGVQVRLYLPPLPMPAYPSRSS